MANPAAGDLSTVGLAVETTSGTYLAPTNWLFPETNGLDVKPDFLKKNLMTGSRFPGRIKRPLKYQIGGPLTYPLTANHGARVLRPTFGAVAGMAALTADTVKAATPISTVAGISTITLTNTAAVTYVKDAWLMVNTSTASELRQIKTITTNTAPNTVITVGALYGNAAAAAGTAVVQPAQLAFTTATTATTIPSLSISAEEAGLYEWQLAGCFVDGFALKAGKDEVTTTTTIFGTKPVVRSTIRTSSLTAAEQSDMSRPFSIMDLQFVTSQDPIQSGAATAASAQQMATWIEEWDFSWSNGLIKKPFPDGTQVYKAFPGSQSASVSYTYCTLGRPAEFEDYIGNLAGSVIPMSIGHAINAASTGAADWRAVGISLPNVVLEDQTTKRQVGDVLSFTIKGDPFPATATGDAVTVYVVNGDGATTTGY